MRRFDFFERFLGVKKPRTFINNTKTKIQQLVLICLQNKGRVKWVRIKEIAESIYEQYPQLAIGTTAKWLWARGLKDKCHNSTSELRKMGYPIIAGLGKKGYRYADAHCEDKVEVWDNYFSAFEHRKGNLEREQQIHIKLLKNVIAETSNNQEKKQLNVILVKLKK